MTEQAIWVPVPQKRRPKPARFQDATERADRIIDWYLHHKPSVKRLKVFGADYQAFKKGCGTRGIILTPAGITYRGFLIELTPS